MRLVAGFFSNENIADVDDTIKITQTSDPVGILKSTFVVSFGPLTKRVGGRPVSD